jgi:hypothetical protein
MSRKKTIRLRRPENFLYSLGRCWADNRSRKMVILARKRESGRPRETRFV